MPFESGLLVSLPASELSNIVAPASLFGREILFEARLSDPLRAAVATLDSLEAPLLFVARPEIFTDGATLEWLVALCHGIFDHLHISDGSTVKLLPGFRNHLFLYGLSRQDDRARFEQLEKRLPEIFAQLHSQVNTALSIPWKDRFIQPQTVVLKGLSAADAPSFELRRLFLNRHSPEDSADRTLSFAAVEPPTTRFRELYYIRLSEPGLRDTSAQAIAELAARLFADPTKCAIFVTPSAAASQRDRLRVLAEGLIDAGVRLPVTTVPNILMATQNLPADALERMSDTRRLMVDDADEFWRSPARFYDTFESVTVYARRRRHDPIAFPRMLNHAYGARTLIAWPSERTRSRR